MNKQAQDSALSRWDERLFMVETGFNLIAAGSIFALMFLGVAQVFGRVLLWINKLLIANFNIDPGIWFAIPGFIDIMEQTIAIFAFLGIAYCQRLGGHVRMDLVLRGFSPRALWISETLAIFFSLCVIAVLVNYSFEHFMRSYVSGDSTMDIAFPVWPSKLLVTVAFALLWLRLLLQLVSFTRLALSPDAVPVGVPTIQTIEEIARHDIDESDDGSDQPQAGRA